MIEQIKQPAIQFLRWSERYTKTDMLYLASGGFWLTAGQAAAALSAFVLSIVFANYVSPHVYGIYKYVLALAGIAAIPTLGAMGIALQRAIARGEDGAARRALAARLWGGAIAALGAGAAAAWYFTHGNVEFGTALIIVALGVPFMEAYSLYDSILQGKGKFKSASIAFVLSSAASTLALIAAVFLFDGTLVALLIAYFGAWAIARIIAWRYAAKLLASPDETTPGTVSQYGLRLSIIGIISTIAGHLDKIILFQFLGPVQLAIYTFAIAMPEQLKAVFKALMPLALSRFAQRSTDEIQSSIHRKAFVAAAVAIPLVAAYILAAPFIFEILFPAYLESVLYSQIFALSVFVVSPYLYSAALQSQQAEKLIAVTDISINLASIILLLVLIPLYGIWGAIAARLVTRVVATMALSTAVRHL